jgi:plastocyanin
MLRKTALAAVLVLASLMLVATASSRPAAKKTLKGTVGPGFTIVLKSHGKKVKMLKAGKYTFSISDKSSIHNFTLEKEKGSHKFEKKLTDTAFTGHKTKTVRLTKGTYKYYCSIHESQMHGFFKVK